MKHHSLKKKNFIATLIWRILEIQITCMQKEFQNFENFPKICLKIYQLDPAQFLSAPGLPWLATLKNTKVEWELLADTDMLLMVGNGIRGKICHSINRCAKANNKCTKDYDKNKELSYLKYWNVNNLYGWTMSQKLPVNGFEWVEGTS